MIKMTKDSMQTSFNKWAVPFGMLVSMCGGILWFAETSNDVKHLAKYVEKIENDTDDLKKEDKRINDRLGRMEGKLDIIVDHVKRRKDVR